MNKILLSNSLGRKLNTLEETKKIGQRIKSFWADIGQNLFFFRAIIGAVNNTPVSKKFGQRIISFWQKYGQKYVAKARCPELWSKLEEDKRWLSETVVLWIGSWYPRYEINKAGRSQTTLSYCCNIFAKAAMFKELPQYPRKDCQGLGLGSFTREMHVTMAGWAIS